jgi:predicted DCC family thiol-disulfide oxidoreductase YuxK
METIALKCQDVSTFTIVSDERCPVVRRLAELVKAWDRRHIFKFINHDSATGTTRGYITELDQSPWSLLLIDDLNVRWNGPEAIPLILTHLPFGKIAAVIYILPGTMWFTRQLYMLVSRSKTRFVPYRST